MLKIKTIQLNISLAPIVFAACLASLFIINEHNVPDKTTDIFYDTPITVGSALQGERSLSPATVKDVVNTKVVSITPPKGTVPPVLTPPAVINRILPGYPIAALNNGIEGTIILSVYIGTSGLPEKIETKQSSGHEILDKTAVQSVSMWKFTPAKRGIQPIGSWFQVPVVFRIK